MSNFDPDVSRALGVNDGDIRVDFSATATTSGLLPNSFYEIVADEDCLYEVISPATGINVTINTGFPAYQYQLNTIATDDNKTAITVIRKGSTSGSMHIRRRKSPHKWMK